MNKIKPQNLKPTYYTSRQAIINLQQAIRNLNYSIESYQITNNIHNIINDSQIVLLEKLEKCQQLKQDKAIIINLLKKAQKILEKKHE